MSYLHRLVVTVRLLFTHHYITLICVVLAFGVSMLVFLPDTDSNSVEKLCDDIVERVQPGHYTPRSCSTWMFTEQSEVLLTFLMEGLQELAGNSLLTSNHVRIPICLLSRDGEVLINPYISQRSGPPRRAHVYTPSLCGESGAPYALTYYGGAVLSWSDTSATHHEETVTGTGAIQLQKALVIMGGADICRQQQNKA